MNDNPVGGNSVSGSFVGETYYVNRYTAVVVNEAMHERGVVAIVDRSTFPYRCIEVPGEDLGGLISALSHMQRMFYQ